jgi:hypothetical protein
MSLQECKCNAVNRGDVCATVRDVLDARLVAASGYQIAEERALRCACGCFAAVVFLILIEHTGNRGHERSVSAQGVGRINGRRSSAKITQAAGCEFTPCNE